MFTKKNNGCLAFLVFLHTYPLINNNLINYNLINVLLMIIQLF